MSPYPFPARSRAIRSNGGLCLGRDGKLLDHGHRLPHNRCEALVALVIGRDAHGRRLSIPRHGREFLVVIAHLPPRLFLELPNVFQCAADDGRAPRGTGHGLGFAHRLCRSTQDPILGRPMREPARPARLWGWPRHNVAAAEAGGAERSEEHTSELQSLTNLVCRLLLEKKKKENNTQQPADNSYADM